MAEKRRPTEKTKTGFTVPVPKRGEVLENLGKIAKGGPPPARSTGGAKAPPDAADRKS